MYGYIWNLWPLPLDLMCQHVPVVPAEDIPEVSFRKKSCFPSLTRLPHIKPKEDEKLTKNGRMWGEKNLTQLKRKVVNTGRMTFLRRILQKKLNRSWRGASVAESPGCSSRGPQFSSHHPHQAAYSCCDCSSWTVHTSGLCEHDHMFTHTH